MRILVTGGAGFIGSALIRHLLAHTDAEICNLDKLTYASDPAMGELDHPRYRFVRGDICEAGLLGDLFASFDPDGVMHLAAESHVDRSIDGPAEFLRTNVFGTFTLLEAALGHWRGLDEARAHAFRFLHVSTDEVYGDLGPDDPPFTETTAYQPSSPYSASKASSDHLAKAWHRTYGLPVLISNCSNNYGPAQFPEKLIPLMVLNAIEGRPLPVYGDGLQVRDWLYVEDHAEALYKVLIQGRVGETYNIGGLSERRNIDVVVQICELLEEECPKKPPGVDRYADLITYVTDRPGHDRRYAIDCAKIQKELGFTPRETFESGLRHTVRWYLRNSRWCSQIKENRYDRSRVGLSSGKVAAAS